MEKDDLEGLADEIRRIIESNRKFLERVEDEDFPEHEEAVGEDVDADFEEEL